jgi:Zn-dependent protease
MLLAISSQEITAAGISVITLVLSIAVHEYFHALAAWKLGDATAESEGRLTLNPISHADPIGTLALPIIASLNGFPAFGWGRPVPTQPSRYTRKVSMRTGMGIVAVAGPFGNLLLGIVSVLVAGICNALGLLTEPVTLLLVSMLQINLILMVFNLLPFHPLDGGKILAAVLPSRYDWVDEWLLRWGGAIVILLVVFGGPVLAYVFEPLMYLVDEAWAFTMEVSA